MRGARSRGAAAPSHNFGDLQYFGRKPAPASAEVQISEELTQDARAHRPRDARAPSADARVRAPAKRSR
ncbi:MAG: hypothetical protein DI566_02285 [Microbacterium sp.]|nr:MAG: hypothetical protein DI566_02285 [Microbacterium sp.]